MVRTKFSDRNPVPVSAKYIDPGTHDSAKSRHVTCSCWHLPHSAEWMCATEP